MRRLGALTYFCGLASLAVLTCHAVPLAPMMAVTVTKNSEILITLPGYDPAGSKLTTKITSLPTVGTLYQISQIFSDYGYEPRRGLPITAASPGSPVVITGSRNRFLYVPPANTNEPAEKWATFTYTVSDRTTTSAPGIVWLVPPHKTIAFTDFSTSLEGWTVQANGNRAAALPAGGLTFEPFSRGILNHYALATEAEINVNKVTKNDDTLWYFVAPAKFMGMHNIAYGGTLKFSWSSAAGDFAAGNINTGVPVIVLECRTCASGAGVRMAVFADDKLLPLDGKPRDVSIPLLESSWKMDPKNTLLPWTTPTPCQFVEVLGDISSLRILGDHTRWYESVAIDKVGYTTGKAVPLACADIYY